jgi:HEAT repeat protein
MQEWREELERFGVQSAQDLVQRLPQLRGRRLITAIELLGKAGDRRAVPALVNLLSSDDPAVRSVAAPSLAMLGGRRALSAAERIALTDASEQARAAAVSALAFMFDEEAFVPLLIVVAQPKESPSTRAAAAEGLGNLLQHADPQSIQFQHARSVLIECLGDPAPEVRFWSAFALGCMKDEEALPHLRRLAASDKSICPGWWAVADEARDAIQTILGEEPPERIPQREAQ